MKPKRVLLAGIYHETHTFLDGRTALADCDVLGGDDLLAQEGDASPIAGAIEVARREGWDLIPAVHVRAAPGPIVDDEVIDYFWDQVMSAMRPDIDGAFLVLHGAMVSTSYDDVEGEVLSRLRAITGIRHIPICGVLDLHANVTSQMAANADGLIAYRDNPHTDARESAVRAADLLARLLRTGERPTTVYVPCPILLPPTHTGTADAPMRSLEAMARNIEVSCPDILAVNVIPGYAFADTPDTGVSLTAVTVGDPEIARAQLHRLREYAWDHRADCNIECIAVDEARRRLDSHEDGPILLVEPSDNIGGGAPGDGTTLLRALIDRDARDAVVVINDPEAVRFLANQQIGATVTVSIGGKGSRFDPGPLALPVDLLSVSDGCFDLEDPQSHLASMLGAQVDMGACAVVRHKGVRILLTSRRTPPFDLGQLRSQGIEPEAAFVIVVKAAVAHRRAYDPIAKASYWVDTPGPCPEDLRSLPYAKVRRPIYPLDDILTGLPFSGETQYLD